MFMFFFSLKIVYSQPKLSIIIKPKNCSFLVFFELRNFFCKIYQKCLQTMYYLCLILPETRMLFVKITNTVFHFYFIFPLPFFDEKSVYRKIINTIIKQPLHFRLSCTLTFNELVLIYVLWLKLNSKNTLR